MSVGAVLVAGGFGAIGKAITKRLMADGQSVIVLGSTPEDDPKVRKAMHGLRRPRYVQCDVTDADAVEKAVRFAAPLRAAIYCAGRTYPGLPSETPPSRVREMVEVNALGCYFVCVAVGNVLVEQRSGGSLLSVSSWAAHVPEPSDIGYGMSKAGSDAATLGLASLLAPWNVRANVLSVGVVGGEGMAARHMEADPEGYGGRIAGIPLGRLATPADVANAAHFLISDDASYITGARLAVDGGAALRAVATPQPQITESEQTRSD